MTATRDRDSDLDTDAAEAAWDERPVFGSRRGLPWWAAVLVALLLSVAGAVVDKSRLVDDQRLTSFGLYHALFLAGCLLAVLAVRRRNLFGPMVQPPLIFAATFIPVQLTAREAGQSTETGTKKLVFEVALPLASSFPWMAGATAATIVIGVIRLLTQRNPNRVAGNLDADADDRPARRERPRDRDRDLDDERPPRRPARDREERPSKPARPPRDDWDREDRDRAPERAPERDRGRPRPQQAARREQTPPPRRPSRDDRDRDSERRERGDRGERENRGERGNRGEAPPRRNPPQRPRDQGGRPQQGRRPRD